VNVNAGLKFVRPKVSGESVKEKSQPKSRFATVKITIVTVSLTISSNELVTTVAPIPRAKVFARKAPKLAQTERGASASARWFQRPRLVIISTTIVTVNPMITSSGIAILVLLASQVKAFVELESKSVLTADGIAAWVLLVLGLKFVIH